MIRPVKMGVLCICVIYPAIALALSLTSPYLQSAQSAWGQETANNDKCFECHSHDFALDFPSGESVSVHVDKEAYDSSVHGQKGFACTTCHVGNYEYPHPIQTEVNYRDFALKLYPVCTQCHEEQLEEIENNPHMVSLAAGNPRVAVCTDCHGKHNIQKVSEAKSPINRTCGKCHGEINELYEKSVHGAALIGEGNPDVPTCTDCHGAHHITGPSNSPFHLFSPQICAKCHGDTALMNKYGINPNVMETYVTDFHGKTVMIFETIASDQETNKPVCIDCHGVHDMLAPTDTHSSVMKENLLVTCRKCHPEASANFPDSWLSHYSPGEARVRPVFFVQAFYWILIPVLIGGAALYVISDYLRQLKAIRRGG